MNTMITFEVYNYKTRSFDIYRKTLENIPNEQEAFFYAARAFWPRDKFPEDDDLRELCDEDIREVKIQFYQKGNKNDWTDPVIQRVLDMVKETNISEEDKDLPW